MASVLANIFMGFYKSEWLNEYNLNKPKFCLIYVDDIPAAFDIEQDPSNILDFLNNRHPNIKFTTTKKQVKHSIAFLDYSFQVSIIKISHLKHITNQLIQDFS